MQYDFKLDILKYKYSKFGKNKNLYVLLNGNCYLIIATPSKKYCISKIDLSDFGKISKFTWSFKSNYNKKYVYRNYGKSPRKTMFLHQYILDGVKGVDHVNGDSLDNTKSNLRLCSQQQNSSNIFKAKSDKKSNLPRGVYRHTNNKFRTFLYFKNVKHEIGVFLTSDEAHLAYKKFHAELNKQFSPYYKEFYGNIH